MISQSTMCLTKSINWQWETHIINCITSIKCTEHVPIISEMFKSWLGSETVETFQVKLGSQQLGKLYPAVTTTLGIAARARVGLQVDFWRQAAVDPLPGLGPENVPESFARHLTSLYQLNYRWTAGWGAAAFALRVNWKWHRQWFGLNGLQCSAYSRRSKVVKSQLQLSETMLNSARGWCRDAGPDSEATECKEVRQRAVHLVGVKMLLAL